MCPIGCSKFILQLLHLKEHKSILPLAFITDDVQLLETIETSSGEFKRSVRYRPKCSVTFKFCYWMDLFSVISTVCVLKYSVSCVHIR